MILFNVPEITIRVETNQLQQVLFQHKYLKNIQTALVFAVAISTSNIFRSA